MTNYLKNGEHVTLTADACDLFPELAHHVLIVLDEHRRPGQPLVAPLAWIDGACRPEYNRARCFFRDELRTVAQ